MEKFKQVKTPRGVNGFITSCLKNNGWEYDVDFLAAMSFGYNETCDVPGTCITIEREYDGAFNVWISTYKGYFIC